MQKYFSAKIFDIVISFILDANLICSSGYVAKNYTYKDVSNVNENLPWSSAKRSLAISLLQKIDNLISCMRNLFGFSIDIYNLCILWFHIQRCANRKYHYFNIEM